MSKNESMTNDPTDNVTKRGAFGWEKITETLFVPVIIRQNCRMVPIRIVESEIIGKYQLLPPEVFSCINIKSFYVTEPEAKLLTHINSSHCDHMYGIKPFEASVDMVVNAQYVVEMTRFLEISQDFFIFGRVCDEKLGIVKIFHTTQEFTLVPYIRKQVFEKIGMFVPRGVVEAFVHDTGSSVAQMLPTSWDVAYIQMLWIYSKQDASTLNIANRLLFLPDLLDRITKQELHYNILSIK